MNYFAIPGIREANTNLKLKTVKNAVLKHFMIEDEELGGKCRKQHLVHARTIYAYLSWKRTDAPLGVIGAEINKDHSSVVHYRKRIENAFFAKDTEILNHLNRIQWNLEH